MPHIVFPFILLKSGIAEPQSELRWTFTRVHFVQYIEDGNSDAVAVPEEISLSLFFLFGKKANRSLGEGPLQLSHGIFCIKFNSGAYIFQSSLVSVSGIVTSGETCVSENLVSLCMQPTQH